MSSDNGNAHEVITPDSVEIPDRFVIPELVTREAQKGTQFDDTYAHDHLEVKSDVKAISSDTLSAYISVYDAGVTYNLQSYFEINEEMVRARVVCADEML